MRTLKLLVLSAAATLLWAPGAGALDSPHNGTFLSAPASCDSCHTLHASAGGTLTKYSSNNYACINCHGGGTGTNSPFTGDWLTGREASTATPGTGDSHNWSRPMGTAALPPQNADMAKYVPNDTTAMQCAACHDVHGKRDATQSIQQSLAPNSVHASYKYDAVVAPEVGSGVSLILRKPAVGAKSQGYKIRTESTTQFKISHDLGATWSGLINYNNNLADVNLDDGTLVKVRFVGAAAGAEWTFYISYPFLRTANDLDQMCLDCHRDRNMNHDCVKGVTCTANGTTQYFSHPVGEALQTNDGTHNHDYDLAAPLDADGTAQNQPTEANPSNALNLVNGKVSCTTCHAPHNADSNSLSVDIR